MIIPENNKYIVPHPNMIFRKRIKTLKKLGGVVEEMKKEMDENIFPTINHSERLRKHGIHSYTWDKVFGKITKKEGKNKIFALSEENKKLIETSEAISVLYLSVSKEERRLLESVFFYCISGQSSQQ